MPCQFPNPCGTRTCCSGRLRIRLSLDTRVYGLDSLLRPSSSRVTQWNCRLFPEFGKQYGVLSEIAHPSAKFFGTHLHKDGDNVILLIGAGLPGGKPRLIREVVTRMLIQVIENQSALLHASVELIFLDEVAEPSYWKKVPEGISWAPSLAVRERWTRRSEDLEKLQRIILMFGYPEARYSLHLPVIYASVRS